MKATKSLTNLQLELLEIFKFDLSESQLLEVKSLLAKYFAEKASNDLDNLFIQNGWGEDKIGEWANEH